MQSTRGWFEPENAHRSGERRSRPRYELQFPLNYKVLNGESTLTGCGTTHNLSSGGVAFEVADVLTPGTYVELAIQWPVALNGTVSLKLMLQGHVAWNEAGRTAVRIVRYHFRTQSKAPLPGAFGLS